MGLIYYNLGEGVQAFTTCRDTELPYSVIQGHQTHEEKVALIDRPDLTREDLEGYDAFVTGLVDVAIGVRTADCIPILLYDPVKRVVAAVHAGWKGTVKRLCQKTVFTMQLKFGSNPADIRAVIGPGIAQKSFQVGEDVVNIFRETGFPMDRIYMWDGPKTGIGMKGGHHLNLFEANRWLLEGYGVLPENIQVCGLDTYTDQSFYSARREGRSTGRMINSIKLLP